MRKLHQATFVVALGAATAFALMPKTARAQDSTAGHSEAKACTATIRPSALHVGYKADRIRVKLSESAGAITAVDGGGVTLAQAADLPKHSMTRSKTAKMEAPKVVMMASEGTAALLWLNTEKATPGTHTLTLTGENGTCAGTLKIEAVSKPAPKKDSGKAAKTG